MTELDSCISDRSLLGAWVIIRDDSWPVRVFWSVAEGEWCTMEHATVFFSGDPVPSVERGRLVRLVDILSI